MSDNLAGIEQNVQFNWAGAERLAAELLATATALSSQIPSRNTAADGALAEWRGRYAHEFEGRVHTCSGDAARLADAMRLAANQVRELARLAREEQSRREAARKWKYEQDHEGFLDKVGDFFGGEDKPPIPPPVQPPHFTAAPQLPAARS
jgi:hypothetical protein